MLWAALHTPQAGWSRIHAAETLALSGEADAVRRHFLSGLPEWENSSQRIGAWRVLTATTEDPANKRHWIQKIEQTAGDHLAPDRLQAIETLAKLGCRLSSELVATLRDPLPQQWTESGRLFVTWVLHLAGETLATKRLLAALRSSDVEVRRRAAYITRRLVSPEPIFKQTLLDQFRCEHVDSIAYPYSLAACMALGICPLTEAETKLALDRLWNTSSAAVRLEISHALAALMDERHLEAQRAGLHSPDVATRIATASVILSSLSVRR